MGITGALAVDDAVIGISHREPRGRGPEGGCNLHALQNEISTEAILALHALQVSVDVIFFVHALFSHSTGIWRFRAKASTQR